MRGVVAYEDFSDFEFFRDFERDLEQSSLRTLYSSGFVTGNWGPHSLNLLLDDRQTFIGDGEVIRQRQLPELEYRLRATKLGRTPLYLQLLSSVNYLMVERSATYDGGYGRADLFPQLSLPVRSVPWLNMSLSVGGRATYYSDSLDPTGQAFAGETLTRAFPTAGAEIVGPSLSRIFDAGLGGFAKLKHVVEPRWSYSYLGDLDEDDRPPLFDEVDTPRATHLARFALVNRLLAKPADATRGGAREILSFELAQAYSLDDTQPLQRSRDGQRLEAWGPLQALLRFNPGPGTNLKAQLNYSTLFKGLESTSLSGNLGLGRHQAGVTWYTRYDPESGETRGDQMGLNAGLEVLPQRLRLDGQINYDLEEGLLQQQRYVADYASQCWGVRLEYREFRAADRRDRDYRLALTLKNVGTFLDLTGGRREEF
jgi:lipopolysaccharide assembly outer membrane protein LptD (OstA)